jgi:hypothetical protein
MKVDVMFIVYCCQCVVIGYNDQVQVQKYFTSSKNPNFHDVNQFGL